MGNPMEVRTEAVQWPVGTVILKPAYYAIVESERTGELSMGLYGVTVMKSDGRSILFPWSRILAVPMDAPRK